MRTVVTVLAVIVAVEAIHRARFARSLRLMFREVEVIRSEAH